MSFVRFLLYRLFSRLADMFIDRQLQQHAPVIMSFVDRRLWRAANQPAAIETVLKGAVMAATGLASVDERQIEQIRRLFDPVKFFESKERMFLPEKR